MTLAATFPPKPRPAAPSTGPFPPKPNPATSAATFPPKPGRATLSAISPPKPDIPMLAAATFPPQPHSSTQKLAMTDAVVASPAVTRLDCLMGSPRPPLSDDDMPEGVSAGGADTPAGVRPATRSARVEGLSSGVLSCEGTAGSGQGGELGVGSGMEGSVVPCDRAAEGSDSIDWEAVRLAPKSKVDILAFGSTCAAAVHIISLHMPSHSGWYPQHCPAMDREGV